MVVYTSQRTVDTNSPQGLVSEAGLGSGVLISNREVMTAAHVVQAPDEVLVVFPSGEQIGARVVASVSSADLAMLRLERNPSLPPVAKLGDSGSFKSAMRCSSSEPHWALPIRSRPGTSALASRRNVHSEAASAQSFCRLDAAINQGNSGGPMPCPAPSVDAKGQMA